MLDIKVADPQRHEALTLFPLVDPAARELPYRLLGDALEAGTLRITEVGAGSVPELLVDNGGDADVLILDGEQLIGAKQNRMTNRTIVLPARAKTRVPVSCMEGGRWHLDRPDFSHSLHHSPSKVRRHARKTEAAYAAARMAASHRVLSDAQGEVWDEIADYSAKMDGRSETGALDHLYDLKSFDLGEWSKSFERVEGQVGLLAFLGDAPLGLDVVGSQALYARLHDRLVRGYIMDALAVGKRDGAATPDVDLAKRYLEKVRAAIRTEAPTVGRGTYRVLSESVIGGELEDEASLVHLCAFPTEDGR